MENNEEIIVSPRRGEGIIGFIIEVPARKMWEIENELKKAVVAVSNGQRSEKKEDLTETVLNLSQILCEITHMDCEMIMHAVQNSNPLKQAMVANHLL